MAHMITSLASIQDQVLGVLHPQFGEPLLKRRLRMCLTVPMAVVLYPVEVIRAGVVATGTPIEIIHRIADLWNQTEENSVSKYNFNVGDHYVLEDGRVARIEAVTRTSVAYVVRFGGRGRFGKTVYRKRKADFKEAVVA